MESEKDSYIRIRIDSATKKTFQDICKKRAINNSELIRQLIIKWIEDNKD